MAAEWQAQTVIKNFALKEQEKYNLVTVNTLCLSCFGSSSYFSFFSVQSSSFSPNRDLCNRTSIPFLGFPEPHMVKHTLKFSQSSEKVSVKMMK